MSFSDPEDILVDILVVELDVGASTSVLDVQVESDVLAWCKRRDDGYLVTD